MLRIKINRYVLIAVIVLSLFLLAGCGKKECKFNKDCAEKACFTAKCVDRMCQYDAQPDCCGNGKCESSAAETKCSCEKDCGKCAGKVESSYLEYACVNNECASNIKKSISKQKTFSNEISMGGFSVIMKSTLDEPFNIDESSLNLKFQLKTISPLSSKPKIRKIQVKARIDNQEIVIGEKEVNGILWAQDDVIEVDIPFSFSLGEEAKSRINVIIFYEYVQKITGAETKAQEGSIQQQIDYELIFVNPGKERKCPESCSDNNECSMDYCDQSTNYFCEHNFKSNCIGNYICESNEDKCTSLIDCGPCNGNIGSYLYMECVNNKCNSKLKKGVQQPIILIESRQFSEFKLEIKITYNEPFEVDNSKFNVDIRLEDKGSQAQTIRITRMKALVGEILLGEKEMTETINNVGDKIKTQQLPISFKMLDYEEQTNVKLKIDYEYNRQVGETATLVRDSFEKTLSSRITFVKTGTIE